jgi:hypothetical protein
MLAVDMMQHKRGMNEVEMNGASLSEGHLYMILEWSCGAYVLPPPSYSDLFACAHSQASRAQQHSDYVPRGRRLDEEVRVKVIAVPCRNRGML